MFYSVSFAESFENFRGGQNRRRQKFFLILWLLQMHVSDLVWWPCNNLRSSKYDWANTYFSLGMFIFLHSWTLDELPVHPQFIAELHTFTFTPMSNFQPPCNFINRHKWLACPSGVPGVTPTTTSDIYNISPLHFWNIFLEFRVMFTLNMS